MSVVVFDTKSNRMYADTVTTLGSVACYNSPKLKQVKFDNGWVMLLGAIGVASQAVIPMNYLCEYVSEHIENGGSIRDLGPNKVHKFSTKTLENALDLQAKALGGFDTDYVVIAALTDGRDVVVGVMDHSMVVCWGIEPIPEETCICIASREVTAAFYSSSGSMRNRLYCLRPVHYIGNHSNTIVEIGFNDDV